MSTLPPPAPDSAAERAAGAASERAPAPDSAAERAADAAAPPTLDSAAERAADAASDVDVRLRERLRVLLCCLVLTALATLTRPGLIIADTKLDMPVNPLGFLGRALHLWDIGQFGQLQNQAGGYLFPMGPFYALGDLIGMPAWVTQRLWLATLLCAAFLGARRLGARLGIGTPTTQIVGGMAYALGPHGLSVLGLISSEYMPIATLPWIILPLVTAAQGGGRVRAAARSGIAIVCCGGINAAATLAVLVVPALYVLTRPRGTPRFRILGWWLTAVVVATLWWLAPLLLLGKYAYSWVTYTEKANTTTAPTGLVEMLRGAERWVNYSVVDGLKWEPVGHALSVDTLPVLCTALLAALGLVGLLRARLPERTFLVLTLLASVVIIGTGHLSAVESPLAPAMRHLIDGPLAPFRNLYKFDPLIRLPLAFGLMHLLRPRETPRRIGVGVAAALALAGVAAPAFTLGLSGPGAFQQIPGYWKDATSWLNARAGEQGVLVFPAARFGEYYWGRPMDDVMQPLYYSRWAGRQVVPAGSTGFTRLLDAIDDRLAAGEGSPGLSQVLGRMGVRYVLIRNDLRRESLRGAWPAREHQALEHSPGLTRVAEFGGKVGATWVDDAVSGFDQPYSPVEIYQVDGADDVVSMSSADQAIHTYGSPETLLALADAGLLKGRPMLLDGDGGTSGRPVVSDGLRLVRRNFGELRSGISPTMSAGQKPKIPPAERDLVEPGWDRYDTVAEYAGIKDITASSSGADIDTASQVSDAGHLPYAAMDGNDFTEWQTGGWQGPVGQWLKVDFDQPRVPREVTAAFSGNPFIGPPPAKIAVETQAGRVVQDLKRGSFAQPLKVPPGRTSWLRIKILSLAWQPGFLSGARVGISELHVDDVTASRHYRLPTPPAGTGNAAIVMSRGPGAAPGCMQGPVRWVCSPLLERQDEEGYGFDRVFPAERASRADLWGTATLTSPDAIQRYTDLDPGVVVSGSSTLEQHPADLPRSAFDGDPATTWIAKTDDRNPWFSVSWGAKKRVGSVTVQRPPSAGGPMQVRVEGANGQWRQASVDSAGRVRFAPMKTDRLTLRFLMPARFDPQPLQITDVRIPGVPSLRASPATALKLPCGYGPSLEVNGAAVPTKATGTIGDVLQGRPLKFRACERIDVRAGSDRLDSASFDYRIESAIVDPGGALAKAPRQEPATVSVVKWTPEVREVSVDAATRSYLTVNENFNKGWQAKIGGSVLKPTRIDGWRQAWVIPAGTSGTVRMTFTPDATYRFALFGGLLLLIMLAAVAAWPARARELRTELTPARAWSRWPALVLAAGVGFWTCGITGVVLGGLVAAVVGWAPTRRAASPWLAVGALLAGAASILIGQRYGGGALLTDTVPQLCGLIAVVRLVMALAEAPVRPVSGGAGASPEAPPRTGSRPPARSSPE